MTDKELSEANEIKEEISNLKKFLFYGERTWTGELIKRVPMISIKSHSYGALGSAIYELDTKTKNEILDFLREKLSTLESRLEDM